MGAGAERGPAAPGLPGGAAEPPFSLGCLQRVLAGGLRACWPPGNGLWARPGGTLEPSLRCPAAIAPAPPGAGVASEDGWN